ARSTSRCAWRRRRTSRSAPASASARAATVTCGSRSSRTSSGSRRRRARSGRCSRLLSQPRPGASCAVHPRSYRLLMNRLGIVGHRCLNAAATAFVDSASRAVLADALATRAEVVALSALAEGADTLFAEAALSLSVPLEVVRPFARYAEDFGTDESRRRYRTLAAAARLETKLGFVGRSAHAYEA